MVRRCLFWCKILQNSCIWRVFKNFRKNLCYEERYAGISKIFLPPNKLSFWLPWSLWSPLICKGEEWRDCVTGSLRDWGRFGEVPGCVQRATSRQTGGYWPHSQSQGSFSLPTDVVPIIPGSSYHVISCVVKDEVFICLGKIRPKCSVRPLRDTTLFPAMTSLSDWLWQWPLWPTV